MHCAQDPTAEPQRMRRARMENKKTGKRIQHTVRRRRNLERSERALMKDFPKAYLVTRITEQKPVPAAIAIERTDALNLSASTTLPRSPSHDNIFFKFLKI